MTNEQISKEIKETEERLAELRKKLTEKKYPWMGLGAHSGSIVLFIGCNRAVVICSKNGEILCDSGETEDLNEALYAPCKIQVKP